MNTRPLRTADDHKAALARIEELWGAPIGSPEGDELEVLTDLVEHYEERHFPIPEGDPIDVLRAHMEQTGKKQADLAHLLGSAPRASEVLQRKRRLNLPMIQRLHTEWGVPTEVLVRSYELQGTQAAAGREQH